MTDEKFLELLSINSTHGYRALKELLGSLRLANEHCEWNLPDELIHRIMIATVDTQMALMVHLYEAHAIVMWKDFSKYGLASENPANLVTRLEIIEKKFGGIAKEFSNKSVRGNFNLLGKAIQELFHGSFIGQLFQRFVDRVS